MDNSVKTAQRNRLVTIFLIPDRVAQLPPIHNTRLPGLPAGHTRADSVLMKVDAQTRNYE